MPGVSIIIPTWNLHDYLRNCLSYIMMNTNPELLQEIIVVDNGSVDDTPKLLGSEKLKRMLDAYATNGLRVIRNDENLGYGPACNQGLEIATGEFVCFLNNDVGVLPGWLPGLLRYMEAASVGAVGPMSNNVSGPQDVQSALYEPLLRPLSVHRLVGHCLLVRKKILDRIGGFDPQFKNAFEDDDLCKRIARDGNVLLVVRDVFVFHHGSMTFKTYPAALPYEKIMNENRERFIEKWGR
jgi:GT2 family glycosyltransferase